MPIQSEESAEPLTLAFPPVVPVFYQAASPDEKALVEAAQDLEHYFKVRYILAIIFRSV